MTIMNSTNGNYNVIDFFNLMKFQAEAETRYGVAHFTRPMAGSVHFHTLNDREGLTTSIYSDLFHVNQDRPAASDHAWKLYITDYTANTRGLKRNKNECGNDLYENY